MEKVCPGNGYCLQQFTDCLYVRSRAFPCTHNCAPQPCPNYAICGSMEPPIIMDCHGGRCSHCDIIFGRDLQLNDVADTCAICLEDFHLFVQMPLCTHQLCLACFRRVHYRSDLSLPEFQSYPPVDGATLVHFPDNDNDDDEENEDNDDQENEDDDDMENEDVNPGSGSCPLCREPTIPGWQKQIGHS
jgi:hypothetical protein